MGKPTDELRSRLDERGIEYETPTSTSTVAHIGDIKYRFLQYRRCGEPALDEKLEGKIFAETEWLTPEQAIAAMVGRRDTMELWPEWEQVLFANVTDEVAQDNLNECVHELLEKAATVGAGTCKLVIEKRPRHGPWIYHYSCGYDFWQPAGCPMPVLKHCPNCGKRIKEEAE